MGGVTLRLKAEKRVAPQFMHTDTLLSGFQGAALSPACWSSRKATCSIWAVRASIHRFFSSAFSAERMKLFLEVEIWKAYFRPRKNGQGP